MDLAHGPQIVKLKTKCILSLYLDELLALVHTKNVHHGSSFLHTRTSQAFLSFLSITMDSIEEMFMVGLLYRELPRKVQQGN